MNSFRDRPVIRGPIVVIGFGSIGRGVLPLILRHFDFDRSGMTVLDPDDRNRRLVENEGCIFEKLAITPDNFRATLARLLAGRGQGVVLNLSVCVSSVAAIEIAQDLGALYLDTTVEPWGGSTEMPAYPCRGVQSTH